MTDGKDLTAKAVKEAIEYIEHSTLKEDKVLGSVSAGMS